VKNLDGLEYDESVVKNAVRSKIEKGNLKLSYDSRFQRAFTACSCVFKAITWVGSNQGNYFKNVTAVNAC